MNEPAPGQVTYLEIGSRHAPATRAFFGAVFNWTLHDDAWFQTPTLKTGTDSGNATPQIYICFHAADLEAAMARVKAAGGEADKPTTQPGFGRFSHCRDPGDIHFGLHQPVTAAGEQTLTAHPHPRSNTSPDWRRSRYPG